ARKRDSARFLRKGSGALASEASTASMVAGAITRSVLRNGNLTHSWSPPYLSLRLPRNRADCSPTPHLTKSQRKKRLGATRPSRNTGIVRKNCSGAQSDQETSRVSLAMNGSLCACRGLAERRGAELFVCRSVA